MGERSEPRTDPLLPVITDAMLPPLERPRVPTLDDRALAEILAELDPDPPLPRPRAAYGSDEPAEAVGVAPDEVVPDEVVPDEAVPDEAVADEVAPDEAVATRTSTRAWIGWEGAEIGPAPSAGAADAGGVADAGGPGGETGTTGQEPPPHRGTANPSAAGGTDARRPSPRQSGTVRRPTRADRRPPVAPTEESEELPLLAGLSRHSYGKVGSRVFTAIFAAIFLLILLQAVIGMLNG